MSAVAIALVFAGDGDAQSPRPVWPLTIDRASATTGSGDEESLLLLQLFVRAPRRRGIVRAVRYSVCRRGHFDSDAGLGSDARVPTPAWTKRRRIPARAARKRVAMVHRHWTVERSNGCRPPRCVSVR